MASSARAPLAALLAAHGVSLVGDQLTLVAVPLFVLQTTGSAALTGIAALIAGLPALVAGLFGGALVDRAGFRRASILADLVGGTGVLLVPLLHHTAGLAFWQLLLFLFLSRMLQIPGLTARRSLVPEAAAHAGVRLERANAWFEGLQSLSFLLGPPTAGLLVVLLGAPNVLWLDAASFALSALLVAGLIPVAMGAPRPAALGGYVAELVEGLRFLAHEPVLRVLALLLMLTNSLYNPVFAVVLPVLIASAGRPATDLGLLLAAQGLGVLIGTAAYGVFGYRLPRRPLWTAGYIVAALPLWLLAAAVPLVAVAAALCVTGVVGGSVNPLLVTVRHERIPARLRGRVFSTFSVIAMAASPLGAALAGGLVERRGVAPTLLLIAALYQLIGLSMLFMPALRHMEVAPIAAPSISETYTEGQVGSER